MEKIDSVLNGFEASIQFADENRTIYCNEKAVVNTLNHKAFNFLKEYSVFTEDDEMQSVFSVLKDMQEKSLITFGHSIVGAAIAMELLAEVKDLELEVGSKDYWELYKGYLLHDIGKLDPSIIDSVNNPNDDESIREDIKKHADPIIVRNMMNKYGIKSDIVFKIAIAHHLRPDGTGYPEKQFYQFVDFIEDGYTEIASLADMIEAIMYNLVTNRDYKKDSDFSQLRTILSEISGFQIRTDICNVGIAYVEKLIKASQKPIIGRHSLAY